MQRFDEIPPLVTGRRCDKGENPRWLTAAIFVDGSEPNSDCTTRSLEEHPRQFSKNPTGGLGGDAITSNCLRTDVRKFIRTVAFVYTS